MAEVPDTVDVALDALSSPTSDEVSAATEGFSARELAAAAAARALDDGGGGGGTPTLEQVLTEGNNSNGVGMDLSSGGIQNAGAIGGVGSLGGTGEDWNSDGGTVITNGGDIHTFGGGIDTDSGDLVLGTGTIGMASGEIIDVAAHLAHGATVNDLIDALVACGLMASS